MIVVMMMHNSLRLPCCWKQYPEKPDWHVRSLTGVVIICYFELLIFWHSKLQYLDWSEFILLHRDLIHKAVCWEMLKEGNLSSVDSKASALSLRETCHCVWAYYWCTVCLPVLGEGQQGLCALSGMSGHLRASGRAAKLTCMCLNVWEIQPASLCPGIWMRFDGLNVPTGSHTEHSLFLVSCEVKYPHSTYNYGR